MDLEIELIEKLLTTFHLNVPERKKLPFGKARFSIIRKIVTENLKEKGCFPIDWTIDEPFVGALLVLENDRKVKLYHKEEASLCNPQLVEVVEYQDLNKAIFAFAKIMYKDVIDGITIDYAM